MEPPVEAIRYDEFRAEVVDTVLVLADPEYQQRVWIQGELPPGVRYDELTYRVHVLYDDMAVLPEPLSRVGAFLYPDEVGPLHELGAVFGSLIDELGNVDDARYLAHPRWPDVVRRAGEAHRVMQANDVAHGVAGPG